jgi:hypothetical protein
MNRKQFLGTFLCAGAAAGPLPAAEDAQTTTAPPLTPCDEKAEFARGWITRFVATLDAEVPAADLTGLMEARGRSCARQGPIGVAEKCRGDVDQLVSTMQGWLGANAVTREGNLVRLAYPRCLCPMVREVATSLSPTYCQCSVGWIKEMFETAWGGPVSVEALETVKRGGSSCRFDIRREA